MAHPVRWRLLHELARSDQRVGELTSRLGERQSLVSYHLGRLRAGRLVTSRRSAADSRDVYYAADLATCTSLLGAAGAALPPGMALTRPVDPLPTVSGRVLFLCTGNSARSQMAEALLQHRTDHRVEAASAGSQPGRLHPNAVRVMRRYGIDLAGRRTKHLDEFLGERFDYVITLCDRVREVCPDFGGAGRAVHWSMPTPAEAGTSNMATYPAFARAAAEISTRLDFFIPLLDDEREGA